MKHSQTGFTLIEAIVVIVITGVIAAVVAVFLTKPVQAYFAAAARAELTDIADTATRRMTRDLRAALPNSIRQPAGQGKQCLEFLPTITGGRYRVDFMVDEGQLGEVLDFASPISSFDVLGGLNPVPATNDYVVVYNLGVLGADAYAGSNRASIRHANKNHIALQTPTQFPLASPASRFQVIPHAQQAVFYVCDNPGRDAEGNGTGVLYRLSGYGINATPPSACPLPQSAPVLADRISECRFDYGAGAASNNGLVSIRLAITAAHETVSLYQAVHINNAP